MWAIGDAIYFTFSFKLEANDGVRRMLSQMIYSALMKAVKTALSSAVHPENSHRFVVRRIKILAMSSR